MKDIPQFAAILCLVALIAAASLSWINEITEPKIAAQEMKALNEGLQAVLPGSSDGVVVPVQADSISYYIGYKDRAQRECIGFAFEASGDGYSSTIRTLVGIDTSGTILAIQVLSQQETPGLGTRCQEIRPGEDHPWWQVQFKGLKATDVKVDKDGGNIESITGATITSRAITNAISEKASAVMLIIQSGIESE
jgi:Na+-translocating ferredoxin:NAD+ oxidoreductase subunit G